LLLAMHAKSGGRSLLRGCKLYTGESLNLLGVA